MRALAGSFGAFRPPSRHKTPPRALGLDLPSGPQTPREDGEEGRVIEAWNSIDRLSDSTVDIPSDNYSNDSNDNEHFPMPKERRESN